MDYPCPSCEFITESLGAWKAHQTRKHGGWDDNSLADMLGATASTEPTRERMNRFAEGMPEDASGTFVPSGEPTPSIPGEELPPPPPEVRRIHGTPRKLKKLIAQIPEVIFDRNGINLDDEDKEAVKEAIEFLENVFGFEFQVPASKYVVESRFWAILWPAFTVLFILLKHKVEGLFKAFNVKQPDSRTNRPEGER